MMSSEKRQVDYVRDVCQGSAKRFVSVPCRYFLVKERECLLLKEKESENFFKKCRFKIIERIYPYAEQRLKYHKKKGWPVDESEDVDYNKIMENIKKGIDNGFQNKAALPTLLSFSKTTTNNFIDEQLRKKRIIPRKKCGTCIHFQERPEKICTKKRIKRNKTDEVGDCEIYQVLKDRDVSIDSHGINDGKKGRDEIETETPEGIFIKEESPDIEEIIKNLSDKRIIFPEIINLLDKRIQRADENSTRHDIYKRQYDIMLEFIHGFAEKHAEKEAKKIVTEIKKDLVKRTEMMEPDRNANTIRKELNRDISQIRYFLKICIKILKKKCLERAVQPS